MSKVLYKKWIPLQYDHSLEKAVKIEGTGKWEDEYNHPGELLTWGTAYEEFESGAGNYTIAIVKKPDGTIEEVLPTHIKFVDEL